MIYNYKTLPYDEIFALPLEARKRGNQGTKNRRKYLHCISAFDIETSRINEDESFMYIWQSQIESWTVTGRSWKEFWTCWLQVWIRMCTWYSMSTTYLLNFNFSRESIILNLMRFSVWTPDGS